MRERAAHASLNQRLSEFPDHPEADLERDLVADEGSEHTSPDLFAEFVAVLPAFQRPLLLYSRNRRSGTYSTIRTTQFFRTGRKGIGRNEKVIVEPAPATRPVLSAT